MPLGPMVWSPDASILADGDPLNLAFLDAATGHSSSMTSVNIQGGPSTYATTSSKSRRLTRHQVLIQEARDFLETTVGDIHASSSSQPNPLSEKNCHWDQLGMLALKLLLLTSNYLTS